MPITGARRHLRPARRSRRTPADKLLRHPVPCSHSPSRTCSTVKHLRSAPTCWETTSVRISSRPLRYSMSSTARAACRFRARPCRKGWPRPRLRPACWGAGRSSAMHRSPYAIPATMKADCVKLRHRSPGNSSTSCIWCWDSSPIKICPKFCRCYPKRRTISLPGPESNGRSMRTSSPAGQPNTDSRAKQHRQ